MANPYFGPYAASPNQQYGPWTYQRTYPYPGFRQTGACPQHGAFYGHGACFQPPQNQPTAMPAGTDEASSFYADPAALGPGLPAAPVPTLSVTNAAVGHNQPSQGSLLSARAASFVPRSSVPESAPNTIPSVGEPDSAGSANLSNLSNQNMGQHTIGYNGLKAGHAEHNAALTFNVPGQAEIGRNTTVTQTTSASVTSGPGASLTVPPRVSASGEARVGLTAHHKICAPAEPGVGLTTRPNISCPVELGLGFNSRREASTDQEPGRNLPVPPLSQHHRPRGRLALIDRIYGQAIKTCFLFLTTDSRIV